MPDKPTRVLLTERYYRCPGCKRFVRAERVGDTSTWRVDDNCGYSGPVPPIDDGEAKGSDG